MSDDPDGPHAPDLVIEARGTVTPPQDEDRPEEGDDTKETQ